MATPAIESPCCWSEHCGRFWKSLRRSDGSMSICPRRTAENCAFPNIPSRIGHGRARGSRKNDLALCCGFDAESDHNQQTAIVRQAWEPQPFGVPSAGICPRFDLIRYRRVLSPLPAGGSSLCCQTLPPNSGRSGAHRLHGSRSRTTLNTFTGLGW